MSGVLLDVPAALGVGRLEPAYGITVEDLENALGELSLGKGDVALIRTGWQQLYHDGPASSKGPDGKGVPGVTGEAAE